MLRMFFADVWRQDLVSPYTSLIHGIWIHGHEILLLTLDFFLFARGRSLLHPSVNLRAHIKPRIVVARTKFCTWRNNNRNLYPNEKAHYVDQGLGKLFFRISPPLATITPQIIYAFWRSSSQLHDLGGFFPLGRSEHRVRWALLAMVPRESCRFST